MSSRRWDLGSIFTCQLLATKEAPLASARTCTCTTCDCSCYCWYRSCCCVFSYCCVSPCCCLFPYITPGKRDACFMHATQMYVDTCNKCETNSFSEYPDYTSHGSPRCLFLLLPPYVHTYIPNYEHKLICKHAHIGTGIL